ncbi:MAG: hypothetical protein ACLF0G_07195 [Candidatus Brocadiia bacterium]
MSEAVTHTAVLDDAFRLMLAGAVACPAFQSAAQAHWDVARLGAVTRSGDHVSVPLLDALRAQRAAGQPEEGWAPKLAFVLGVLCHRAADRQMKPLFRALEPDSARSPTECSIYHDVFLLREVYGDEEPFRAEMFADPPGSSAGPSASAVEDLFQALLARALVQMHTLIPDAGDPEGWLERLLAARQRFRVELPRYAAAIASPDPLKLGLYIQEPNFYDPADALIGAARRIQHGEPVAPDALQLALRSEPASHYAQALRLALGYLDAASEFFSGEISAQALRRRLDIGEPGRDGRSV